MSSESLAPAHFQGKSAPIANLAIAADHGGFQLKAAFCRALAGWGIEFEDLGTNSKDNDKIIGGRTRVKVVKNKMASPFREAEFDAGYGTGISRLGEVIDIGVEDGIVEKSGSWLSYKDGRLGQGRDAAIRFLAEHPEVDAELSKQILAKHGLGRPAVAATPAPAKAETTAPAKHEAPAAPAKPQPAKVEKPATRAAA